MIFALSWALITGFNSPLPWFYPVFFALMISHRAYRDIKKCEAKYGEAWQEYKRQVPYLFIPSRLEIRRPHIIIEGEVRPNNRTLRCGGVFGSLRGLASTSSLLSVAVTSFRHQSSEVEISMFGAL
ncbi:MAG: hypothetical protein Q9188_002607 [Gyalolechia gomerana]